ncbi:MAG TPA: class I SAM-dependent methyltransferase [Beijerinckiaceae bacterium]|jgi:SAM-dependent methyltransferase
MPPNVALMHVLIEARDEAEARNVLHEAVQAIGRGAAADAIGRLLGLFDTHPQAFAAVKSVLARVVHDAPSEGDGTVRALAAAFDAAAQAAPEASVALYTLGSPDLMRAATEEIVAALRRWGVVAPDRAMLEIGCGIGRFQEALAPALRFAVGIDVSRAMLRAARERCAGLANAAFAQTSGLDLAAFRDESFDLVLAADSFPYLVQAGPALLARHVAEAARVLRPGGDLVILNLSYRGDLDQDRHDLAALAAGAFEIRRNGTQGEFSLWDGAAFHLSRRKEGQLERSRGG